MAHFQELNDDQWILIRDTVGLHPSNGANQGPILNGFGTQFSTSSLTAVGGMIYQKILNMHIELRLIDGLCFGKRSVCSTELWMGSYGELHSKLPIEKTL